MKLTSLRPVALHDNLFVFLCPHCIAEYTKANVSIRERTLFFLVVKNAVMTAHEEQADLLCRKHVMAHKGRRHVTEPMPDNMVCDWGESMDFETMTVTPDVSYKDVGHGVWHIENGEVTEVK